MSQPVIIWRKWDSDRNLTILRVDLAYVPSFCEHLKARQIHFSRSDATHDEWGMDRENQRWSVVTNELVLQGILGPDVVLSGWEIPQAGF